MYKLNANVASVEKKRYNSISRKVGIWKELHQKGKKSKKIKKVKR